MSEAVEVHRIAKRWSMKGGGLRIEPKVSPLRGQGIKEVEEGNREALKIQNQKTPRTGAPLEGVQ